MSVNSCYEAIGRYNALKVSLSNVVRQLNDAHSKCSSVPSTILSAYVYGESGFKYLFPKITDKGIMFIKVALFGIIIASAVVSPVLLWDLVDVSTALMAIINVYAIFSCRRIMLYEYYKK